MMNRLDIRRSSFVEYATNSSSHRHTSRHFDAVRQRRPLQLNGRSGQRGVALIVALLLLLVITLVGLAAVRGTIMQQKMASNVYDRQVAFQSSEGALRAAQELITSNPKSTFIRDCSALGANACLGDPFDDANANTFITDVGAGSASGQFTASTIATGQPQFVVENMGKFADPSTQGQNQTANSMQYGGSVKPPKPTFFRITTRSGNPATVGGRAVVTLQTMVKLSVN